MRPVVGRGAGASGEAELAGMGSRVCAVWKEASEEYVSGDAGQGLPWGVGVMVRGWRLRGVVVWAPSLAASRGCGAVAGMVPL